MVMERVTNTRPLSLWTSAQYTSLVRLENKKTKKQKELWYRIFFLCYWKLDWNIWNLWHFGQRTWVITNREDHIHIDSFLWFILSPPPPDFWSHFSDFFDVPASCFHISPLQVFWWPLSVSLTSIFVMSEKCLVIIIDATWCHMLLVW